MIYLNAGNLWTDEYLDNVIMLNDTHENVKVRALFGSIALLTPTARAANRIPYLGWDEIEEYVKRAQDSGIAIRYTLNQSCVGSIQDFKRDWDETYRDRVLRLHNIGVYQWTVTSPLLVELLREMFSGDFIEVSTIAEVASAEDARRWLDLGVDGFNLSTSINRDFRILRDMYELPKSVSTILANEACLWRCPWRRECYNLSSHNSDRSEELFAHYPFSRCTEVRLADPAEWIRSRLVLPQWMKFYQEHTGINWFKIAFRTHPIEVALPILKAYMDEQWGGNLLFLWPTIAQLGHTKEPKDITNISAKTLDDMGVLDYFIHSGSHCKELSCDACGYCDKIYKAAVV